MTKGKKKKDKPRKRCLTIENKLMAAGEEVGGGKSDPGDGD